MQQVETERAPEAIGPYSQALVANGFVFASGQIGLDPATMTLVEGDVVDQARQALGNLREVLSAAGCGLDQVVKTTMYLADMGDFQAVNQVYAEFFGSHRPARAAIAARDLPKGALFEIEAIALAKS